MDDLGLQRLEAVADAAQAVSDWSGKAKPWLHAYPDPPPLWLMGALRRALDAAGKGREIPEMEYDNGPWASTESDSCVDVAGHWHFPDPDVSDEAEVKEPIHIVPLKQGYVVTDDALAEMAFTDAVDLAEWLLEWMGLEDYQRGLTEEWFKRERAWRSHEHKKVLAVARAAQAYVEAWGRVGLTTGGPQYDRLAEAVEKWREIGDEEVGEAAKRRRGLT